MPSPDHRSLFAYSCDIYATYAPNHLTLYRVTGDGLVEEAHLDGDNGEDRIWGPVVATWKDNNPVIFQKMRLGEDGEVRTPVTLARRQGLWYASEHPEKALQPAPPATAGEGCGH